MLTPNRTGQIWYVTRYGNQDEYIIFMIIKDPYLHHEREDKIHKAIVLDANIPQLPMTLYLYEQVDVSWEKRALLSWQRVL